MMTICSHCGQPWEANSCRNPGSPIEQKPLSDMARRAKLRPTLYNQLKPSEQWAIDKELGILDWDGS